MCELKCSYTCSEVLKTCFCLPYLIWAIPCQRSKKKGQRQKVDFFDEMSKIIWQFDDFGRLLNNFCKFKVFLAQKKKYQKKTVLKKRKLKRRTKSLRLNNLRQISCISFL